MSRIIEQKQMKDFLKLYTGLVERCFESCCNDFTSKALSSKEDTCVSNCIQKFLKHSERVGARFGEENAKMMAQQQNNLATALLLAALSPLAQAAALSRTQTALTAPASSTSTLPASPPGATLVQYKGCSSSSYTIPMFVNKNFPISGSTSASTVWIVQHGSGRNSNDYFSSVYNIVGDQGVVIAPNFYASSDTGRWFQPTKNLAWNSNDWNNGADAVAPRGVSSCSSYDVYDSLIALLRNKAKFPNVDRIFVVGHSAGASMMAKYGMLKPDTGIRYVLANSPSMPYFTQARPNRDVVPKCAADYDTWGYGWDSAMPRYVAARNPGGVNAFRNWVSQDITLMTGTYDTYSRDPTGDQSCPVHAQGGQNRRDRGYAFWAYINLLGGTSTDVSHYYGYNEFQQQNVTSLTPSTFAARHCTVPGVAHDNNAMFASDCGRSAILGASSIPLGLPTQQNRYTPPLRFSSMEDA
ncbi:uncharacterized protein UBRO2_03419 [Ustilago bromivora]|uniref:Tim10-like domain-containing protein n=1 Tax=Ustilago bromivora TaxID=307758 RepID=A0A8H8TSX5_9BASI|nr:uncharacterized protein UBRO2_03419 [Ustilago bromivora]